MKEESYRNDKYLSFLFSNLINIVRGVKMNR